MLHTFGFQVTSKYRLRAPVCDHLARAAATLAGVTQEGLQSPVCNGLGNSTSAFPFGCLEDYLEKAYWAKKLCFKPKLEISKVEDSNRKVLCEERNPKGP